ncbi:PaaI family thioesterase [Streptomyces sp. NPDC099088]|uniref:PaaI family thioesterase n=1 Tax=Streptomyces sp. NPDC099088 TaxID=3366101 RepID=UPI003800D217
MGLTLTGISSGAAVVAGQPSPELLNENGTAHFGYLAALMDSALSAAVVTLIPQETSVGTTQLNLHSLRPIPAGTALLCQAFAQHIDLTVATARAAVFGEADGTLHAYGTATFTISHSQ